MYMYIKTTTCTHTSAKGYFVGIPALYIYIFSLHKKHINIMISKISKCNISEVFMYIYLNFLVADNLKFMLIAAIPCDTQPV